MKQHRFTDLSYGAKSWNSERRVIARLEGAGRDLYDRLHCARGEMENRIKEQQFRLFSDGTTASDNPPHRPNGIETIGQAPRRAAIANTTIPNTKS